MNFKKGLQQEEFWKLYGHPIMQSLLIMLDCVCQIFTGRELTVTSTFRKKGKKPSYHPKWQAFDIRVWDMPKIMIRVLVDIVRFMNFLVTKLKLKFEGRFDVVHETERKDKDGKIIKGQHLHIEYDTGDPE